MDNDQNIKVIQSNDGRQMTLIDQIVRNKVFGCRYWKEECFGLTAVSLLDKAIKLDAVGGTYSGTGKPTPFLCLLMKLLQINPEWDIVKEYLESQDFKYVNALALFYIRMTGKAQQVYLLIEKFYKDFRKLRIRNLDGTYAIWHMDEFAEKLLQDENIFGIALPRIQKRWILEDLGHLQIRKSVLDDELQEQEIQQQEQQQNNKKRSRSRSNSRSNSRNHSRSNSKRKHKHKKHYD